MNPSPTPAKTIASVADAAASIAQMLTLPSWARIIAYLIAAVGGGVAIFFTARYLTGWWNELSNGSKDASATQGRVSADQSDQDLNSQTGKLPKD